MQQSFYPKRITLHLRYTLCWYLFPSNQINPVIASAVLHLLRDTIIDFLLSNLKDMMYYNIVLDLAVLLSRVYLKVQLMSRSMRSMREERIEVLCPITADLRCVNICSTVIVILEPEQSKVALRLL